MTGINVELPPSLHPYASLLNRFVEGMVLKLDMNSYKKTPDIDSVPEMTCKLMMELTEFYGQFLTDGKDENVLIELMDVANFAFLIYVALRDQGVIHVSDNRAAE